MRRAGFCILMYLLVFSTPVYADHIDDTVGGNCPAKNKAAYVQGKLIPGVDFIAYGVVVDDEYTYFDPISDEALSKSQFADRLWRRGDDPNTIYPDAFPKFTLIKKTKN